MEHHEHSDCYEDNENQASHDHQEDAADLFIEVPAIGDRRDVLSHLFFTLGALYCIAVMANCGIPVLGTAYVKSIFHN